MRHAELRAGLAHLCRGVHKSLRRRFEHGLSGVSTGVSQYACDQRAIGGQTRQRRSATPAEMSVGLFFEPECQHGGAVAAGDELAVGVPIGGDRPRRLHRLIDKEPDGQRSVIVVVWLVLQLWGYGRPTAQVIAELRL